MAFSIWRWSFISKADRQLPDNELLLLMAHEKMHRENPRLLAPWDFFGIKKDELRISALAFQSLLRRGVDFDSLIRAEINCRFRSKFGVSFFEFKRIMRGDFIEHK